jgi:hypothetical protein
MSLSSTVMTALKMGRKPFKQNGKQVSVRGRNVFLNALTGQFQTRFTDVYGVDGGYAALPNFDNETGMSFPSVDAQFKAAEKRGEVKYFKTKEEANKYAEAEHNADDAELRKLLGKK